MQKYKIVKLEKDNTKDIKKFLRFPLNIYGNNPATWNSISKTGDILKVHGKFQIYLAVKESGDIAGRMAIGKNDEIKDSNGRTYGQIGLFEVIEDYTAFSAMIDFAKSELRGHVSILFPFFISTWYSYRFTIPEDDKFDFFMEPPGKKYYSEFANRYGVDKTYNYKSYISYNVDGFMKKNEKKYHRLLEMGYRFRKLDKKKIREELKTIYEMSISIFNKNLFYSEISFEDFCKLNESSLKIVDSDFLIIVEKEGRPAGFAFAAPDYTPVLKNARIDTLAGKIKFLLNKNRVNGYIYKTMAVMPEHRRLGMHEAMSHVQALAAKKRGYEYLIAALVYEENPSSDTLIDVTDKSYELYEIKNQQ